MKIKQRAIIKIEYYFYHSFHINKSISIVTHNKFYRCNQEYLQAITKKQKIIIDLLFISSIHLGMCGRSQIEQLQKNERHDVRIR